MRIKKTLGKLAKSGRLGVVAQVASGRIPGAIGDIFHSGHMDGVNDNDYDPVKKKKKNNSYYN